MTITRNPIDPATEVAIATEKIRRATFEYILGLKEIVGHLDTLALGDHGFDFLVGVTADESDRIGPLICDLGLAIEDEYGIMIRTRPVATPSAG